MGPRPRDLLIDAVQAIDDRARTFYERFGFRPFSDREPLMLVLRMSEIAGLLAP